MTFLPIVARELRVAARRPVTHWSRALAALVATAICGLMALTQLQVPPRLLGQTVFTTVAGLFGLVALVAGVRYTADCLSEEKRDGTLGLLFLTDLRGYDVVLGKLAATSLNAVYSLLAVLPVLAIPLLMGGVSFGQFGRTVLVLINALFFSLAVGLFVSALSRDSRKAMGSTFALIAFVHLGIPLLGAYIAYRTEPPASNTVFLLPSSGYAFAMAHDLAYPGGRAEFWSSLATTHLLGWAFLAGAGMLAPRTWQDRPPGTRAWRWSTLWRRTVFGANTFTDRQPLLDVNPCLWLGARDRRRAFFPWIGLVLIGLIWIGGWVKWGLDWLELEVLVVHAFMAHLALKLTLASEACLRLGPGRRDGTLELLLSTPLRVNEILHGHMLGLRRQFLGPILVILAVDLLCVVAGYQRPGGFSQTGWGWFCLVGIASFLADLYTLAWVGLWTGLTARQVNRAAGATVARVLVLPWVIWFSLIVARESQRAVGPGPGEGALLLLWFGIGLVTDAALLCYARFRLHRDLRVIATERQEPAGARWFRLLVPRPRP